MLQENKKFPGLEQYRSDVMMNIDNFLDYFDFSWFKYLPVRDGIISYTILLRKLADKINESDRLAALDELQIWLNIGLDQFIPEAITRYILNKKLYLYLIVRPLRIALKTKRERSDVYTSTPLQLTVKENHTLIRYQYPMNLLKRVSKIIENEGYEGGLTFLKKFMRLSESLGNSLKGKIDKPPLHFVKRLVELLQTSGDTKEIDIEGVVSENLSRYFNLVMDSLRNSDMSLLDAVPVHTFNEFLYEVHTELELEIDSEYVFNALDTIPQLVSYFKFRYHGETIPESLRYQIPKQNILQRIFSSKREIITLEKRGVQLRRYAPTIDETPLYYFKMLWHRRFTRSPKRADQMRLLEDAGFQALYVLDTAQVSRIERLHKGRTKHLLFDTVSFLQGVLFVNLMSFIIYRLYKRNLKGKVALKIREEHVLEFFQEYAAPDVINAIESFSLDENRYSKDIIDVTRHQVPYELSEELPGINDTILVFPKIILEKLYRYLLIVIIQQLEQLLNTRYLKIHNTDWLIVYLHVFHRLIPDLSLIRSGMPGEDAHYNFGIRKTVKIIIQFSELVSKRCSSCQTVNPMYSSFCQNCGNPT
jgi:hypothetical protein